MNDFGVSVIGTNTRPTLFSGDKKIVTKAVTIAESQTITKGTALGLILAAVGTPAAGGGNTGDGTITGYALAAGGPAIVGNYSLVCVAAAVNGGTFELYDPNGKIVGTVEVGTAFTGGGLTFTVADGATDFVVGDTFTLPVAAGSGQAKALDANAVDGSEKLDSIASEDVTTEAAETAVTTSYAEGQFNAGEITIANGDVDDYREEGRILGIHFENAVPA